MLYLTDFLIEGMKSPLSVDEQKPRFSWKLRSGKINVYQKNYQITVLNENDQIMWDSGVIASDQSIGVAYEGKELLPLHHYRVSLKVQDNNKEEASLTSWFETGFLSANHISASFITAKHIDFQNPIFYNTFTIRKKVKRARIYASALGVYEITLNHQKVGDYYFAPFWTSYQNTLQYQTYDVTEQLKEKNDLEVIVNDGWYKGPVNPFNEINMFGDTIACFLELHLTYDDGTKEIFMTDESWQIRKSQIIESSFYHGEFFDSTLESNEVYSVTTYPYDKSKMIAQINEPVRIIETLTVKEKILTPKKEQVFDFGQNISGFIEINIKGTKGQEIVLTHAEILDKEGNFYTENLRAAKCTDRYILNGENQVLSPHFTFHGFRYLKVEGAEVTQDQVKACVVHSDIERTGYFKTENALINQLYSNIVWSQRDNFVDIPSDCPQRDERLGWTGDAQIFARTASFNYNVNRFFKKWLRDLAMEQRSDGRVPLVIPNVLGPDWGGAAAWGDAATIIPWVMYQVYNDESILSDQYPSMKAWVNYIRLNTNKKNGLWQDGFQYGDWLSLDRSDPSGFSGATDEYLIASSYYLLSTRIVASSAKILGYTEDAEEYQELYSKTLSSFQEEYITKTGRVISETQTAGVVLLHFDLVVDQLRDRIVTMVKNKIAKFNDHIATGFVGTPYILLTLSDHNLHDLAAKLLLQEEYPGWLYEVKRGATTIWERWNGIMENGEIFNPAMNSFNHYAYGSIGEWLYRKVAGIDFIKPGYKEILIRPMIVPNFGAIEASYESSYGTIRVQYNVVDNLLRLKVEIPCNTSAKIYLPNDQEAKSVGSGTYQFEKKLV